MTVLSGPGEEEQPDKLSPTEFAVSVSVDERIQLQESNSGIAHRRTAMTFLFWMYGFALASTITIIFLQGFRLGGFQLDAAFLNWLGGATVGEIGILAGMVYGGLFKQRR